MRGGVGVNVGPSVIRGCVVGYGVGWAICSCSVEVGSEEIHPTLGKKHKKNKINDLSITVFS